MNGNNKTIINKSLAKPLAVTAGLLGLIQGIAWTTLSVLCICCYTGSIQLDKNASSAEYYRVIYVIFLHEPNKTTNSELLIQPKEFLIFMCFYAAFSAIWLCISGAVIWAMIHNKWQLTKCLFGGWSTTAFIISLVDIILTSLLGRDYARIENTSDLLTLVCYGIVMSLACRGYVLWVVNVVFAVVFLKFTIKIVLKENQGSAMPIIHGYESNNNPPWFNDSDKDLWSSPAKAEDTIIKFHKERVLFPASVSQQDDITRILCEFFGTSLKIRPILSLQK
ncbi:hypothetical protein TcasGA2_TC032636 [Tribolium castaneum]|uniref:Uncharacterized protein n=1 Tax=Tribolium castaneum TaxID=7070 RepID=A0A139WK66_TRICA|nr:hypothetical protein TcasGA2_TC032636 [Tribolium castaneum]